MRKERKVAMVALQAKWDEYLAAHLASKANVPGAYEQAQVLAQEHRDMHAKVFPDQAW